MSDKEQPQWFKDFIAKSQGGNSQKSGSATDAITGTIAGKVDGVIDPLIVGFKRLATGTADASSAVDLVKGLGKNIPVIGGVIDKVGDFGNAAIAVNTQLNRLSETGVSYRNNLGQFMESALGARMSLDGWEKMLAKSSQQLTVLGSTAGQGAINFGLAAKQMQEMPAGTQLREMGVSAEHLNEVLLLSASSRTKLDLADKNSRDQAVASALDLATQMDSVAKITGKNKEALMKEQKDQLARADVQAALLGMTKEQQKSYEEIKKGLVGAGKGVNDLFSEMVTGGVRSEKGRTMAASIGSENAAEMQRIATAMKTANPEEQERLKKELELVNVKIAQYQASDTGRAQAQYAKGGLGSAAQENLMERLEYVKQVKDLKDQGKSDVEILAELKKRSANEQAGAKPDSKDGKVEEGSKLGRTINNVDQAIGGMSAALGGHFKKAGDEVGTMSGEMNKLNSELKSYAANPNKFSGNIDELMAKVKGADTSKELASAEAKKVTSGGVVAPVVKRATGSPGWGSFLSGSGGLDSVFEDFGKASPAMLHGKETVAKPEQLQALVQKVKDSVEKQFSAASANVPNLPGMGATAKTTEGFAGIGSNGGEVTNMFKEMFDRLNSTLETLAANSSDMLSKADRQIKVTKSSATGNRI